MISVLITTVVIVVIVLLWFIVIYNKLVRLRNMKDEGWSDIDVQLKRRANLIPNVIESVKGYMVHERSLLEDVTKLRTQAMSASKIDDKIAAESALSDMLGKFFALAENYPDLKADNTFVDLQQQLAAVEDGIQMARRYYNGTVRNLNVGIESFPNGIVANMFDFEKIEFFEIVNESDREVPKVDFSS